MVAKKGRKREITGGVCGGVLGGTSLNLRVSSQKILGLKEAHGCFLLFRITRNCILLEFKNKRIIQKLHSSEGNQRKVLTFSNIFVKDVSYIIQHHF